MVYLEGEIDSLGLHSTVLHVWLLLKCRSAWKRMVLKLAKWHYSKWIEYI